MADDSTPLSCGIPRNIWVLWLQGWQHAPALVSACLRTWVKHNPGWNVRAISQSSLHEVLDVATELSDVSEKAIPNEALSDVIRLALLRRHGGVWVDATAYCLAPLDSWLWPVMGTGFFAFERPSPDRMISSWFLASARQHYVIDQWLLRTRRYWSARQQRDDYFWLHRLFADAYLSDPAMKAIWDATPKRSAKRPLYYYPYRLKLAARVSERDRELVAGAALPLLKLTHKVEGVERIEASVARYLEQMA